MSQFFARLFQMIATDAIVTALAHNKRFQFMALRIDAFLNKNQKVVSDKAEDFAKVAEQTLKDPELKRKAEQAASDLRRKAESGGFTASRFLTALKKEFEKDLQSLGGGKS